MGQYISKAMEAAPAAKPPAKRVSWCYCGGTCGRQRAAGGGAQGMLAASILCGRCLRVL